MRMDMPGVLEWQRFPVSEKFSSHRATKQLPAVFPIGPAGHARGCPRHLAPSESPKGEACASRHKKEPARAGSFGFIMSWMQDYLSIASMVPAATAVPMTPATFGPMACIRR